MKISIAKEWVRKMIQSGVVPMLWGPPGIGKSAIVKQIAEEEGIGLIDLRLSLLDAVDLRGLPKFDDGHVLWARPEFIPEKGSGILFLDEITTALPAVQNSALQLIYDRRCGPHVLGDGWSIVCAGNRKEDMAHVFNLSSALINRMVHLFIDVDVEDVIAYGVENGWTETIIGFLKWRPSLVYTKPRTAEPFASPRSYEFLSRMIHKTKDINIEVVKGIIGEEAGTEFMTYLKVYQHLPDIDAILRGGHFKIPDEPSARIALVTGIALRVNGNGDMNTFFSIIDRFSPELSVMGVKLLLKRQDIKKQIITNENFSRWVEKYKEVIL
jgi:hypothetical protein